MRVSPVSEEAIIQTSAKVSLAYSDYSTNDCTYRVSCLYLTQFLGRRASEGIFFPQLHEHI